MPGTTKYEPTTNDVAEGIVQPSDPASSDSAGGPRANCHLEDDFALSSWPESGGEPLFADDDLRVSKAVCACGRLYLLVVRRVPGEMWDILVPVSTNEVEALVSRVHSAAPSYTDKWLAAETGVIALTETRRFLEHSSKTPMVLRWCPPGRPIALTVSPS